MHRTTCTVWQSGVTNTACMRSYCTKKILKVKHKNKELTFSSLRNYSVDVYKQDLKRVSFLIYENFDNPDIAYNNFINILDLKQHKWFDGEIPLKMNMCDKLYKSFNLTKSDVDEEIYMEAQSTDKYFISYYREAPGATLIHANA